MFEFLQQGIEHLSIFGFTTLKYGCRQKTNKPIVF
jgi:hypothetical protein